MITVVFPLAPVTYSHTFMAGYSRVLAQYVNATNQAIASIESDLALKADIASPQLTGTPTATTAASLDSSTRIATTAFVHDVIQTINTGVDNINHYHTSDRDRANHTGTQSADTVVDGTTNKVFTASDKTRLAGTTGTNTGDQNLSGYALLASPAFIGAPTAPTPSMTEWSDRLATTAYVKNLVQTPVAIQWSAVSKAGSSLAELSVRDHKDLQNINNVANDVSAKHNFDNIVFPTTNELGTFAQHYTLSDFMNYSWSAGIVGGCGLTDNADGTVSIAAGVAVIRANTTESGTLYGVAVAAQLNIALTDNAANYIYLTYNAGAPVFMVATSATIPNGLDKVLAFVVHRDGNSLHWIDSRNQNTDSNRKTRKLFLSFSRFLHASGGTTLGANALALTVTAGSFFFMLEELVHPAFDTSVVGTANENVFVLWYRDGAGGWTDTTNTKAVTTTTYDGNTGTPVTLGNNKYGVSWVYIVNDSPSELHVVMGQQEYPSLAAANVATPPSSIPTLVSSHGSLIGYVVYEKAATVFDNILSSFSQTFVPSAATIHNGLSTLQGGAAGEYYHLTAAEYAALGATAITLATARQVSTLRV